MLVIDHPDVNPYFNLAMEEFLLKEIKEDCFRLWINSPSIIVGKNQNTLAEINLGYVREKQIPVVRRLSGGGAVFHDPGNLNFTFIMDNQDDIFSNFRKFTRPILEVLSKLNIAAELSGRNDLTINGKKFSGNAQYIYKNRILHHGTLLFSTNISDLSLALKSDPEKFKDKGVKSISSRVTNICEYLTIPLSIQQFRQNIMDHILQTYEGAHKYRLSHSQLARVNELTKEKYNTWEWNFGSSPKYNFKKKNRFSGGTVEFNLDVHNGIIESARIFGDFFGKRDVEELESALIGIEHNETSIKKALSAFPIQDYFANITLNEIVQGLF